VKIFTNCCILKPMATTPELQDRPRVLVVGGGYVGLYVALKLQKKIANAGGIVTLVDPLPYMTYQPFLPGWQAATSRHAMLWFPTASTSSRPN
jgi:NADH dehydrogenase